MRTEQTNEIVLLTDNVEKRYSIGCGNCNKSITHKCDNLNEAELHLFGHKYSLDRDESDSVYLLKCIDCDLVDITPFMDDVRQSIASHEALHDYILAMTNNDAIYFHPVDVMMHEWNRAESLPVYEQDDELFRIERITRWLPKVVDVEALLAAAAEIEGK